MVLGLGEKWQGRGRGRGGGAREEGAAEYESNDDVGWCRSVGEEVEACMTSEKLVPAGKIIWIISRHLVLCQEPRAAYGLGDSSNETVTPQGPRSVCAVRARRCYLNFARALSLALSACIHIMYNKMYT
jgi:hypothetical protein